MTLEDDSSAKGFRQWLEMVFRRLARLEKPTDFEKEIEQLIDEGEQRGLISEDEGEMIQGIFSFRDTVAREVMVPRTDTVCAWVGMPIDEIIRLIVHSGHSRIPVYQEEIDNIIGILHAKDLLHYWGRDDIDIRRIVRPPYFIPETKKIGDLLKDLQDKKSHMAIVIDEYGGTSGILTLEDIIEEIMGDIMDEYDAEPHWILEDEDGSLVVDARLDVEELEDYLGVDLPEGKFESVGGLLINFLEKVPAVNEEVVVENIRLTVEAADNRKIKKVRVRRIAPEPEQPRALLEQRTGS